MGTDYCQEHESYYDSADGCPLCKGAIIKITNSKGGKIDGTYRVISTSLKGTITEMVVEQETLEQVEARKQTLRDYIKDSGSSRHSP
jgi:hypothetical protein